MHVNYVYLHIQKMRGCWFSRPKNESSDMSRTKCSAWVYHAEFKNVSDDHMQNLHMIIRQQHHIATNRLFCMQTIDKSQCRYRGMQLRVVRRCIAKLNRPWLTERSAWLSRADFDEVPDDLVDVAAVEPPLAQLCTEKCAFPNNDARWWPKKAGQCRCDSSCKPSSLCNFLRLRSRLFDRKNKTNSEVNRNSTNLACPCIPNSRAFVDSSRRRSP